MIQALSEVVPELTESSLGKTVEKDILVPVTWKRPGFA